MNCQTVTYFCVLFLADKIVHILGMESYGIRENSDVTVVNNNESSVEPLFDMPLILKL